VKQGEKLIWGFAAMISAAAMYTGYVVYHAPAKLTPTFQVESPQAARGEIVYRKNNCSACHRIWDLGGSKGGSLDGIGSRRDPAWLIRYLSAPNPQVILPSTQKAIYRMPSFAGLSQGDRADLVAFLVSLKARDPDATEGGQGS
jgi:cytochrome c2